MQTLKVDLGARSYPIYIGTKLNDGALIREALPEVQDVLIVTNTTIAPLYLEEVSASLAAQGFKPKSLILEDGEQFKTIDSYCQIMTALLQDSFGRDCAIAALGGGVIGDTAGFAAATYQRGVNFIQIPTTLLAMVDSSVGGKTAVNHPLGKNMIGAFYQPKAVIADISRLKTLPRRQVGAGLGEIVKYGIFADKDFFALLERNAGRLLDLENESELLGKVVRRCCEIKAEVVAKDEREGGVRALLNLGHTFGHAVEVFLGYGNWLHGEGVGLGCAIASALSCKRGLITKDDYARIIELLKACDLPTEIPSAMQSQDFLRLMRHDKKVRHGVIRYVLPTSIGSAKVFADVSDAEVSGLINAFKLGQFAR